MPERATRGPAAFREADIKRVIRAIEAAGHRPVRVMVARDGTISVSIAGEADAEPERNEWDEG